MKQYRILRDSYDGVYPSDHYPIQMKLTLSDANAADDLTPGEVVPIDHPIILH